MKKYSALLLGGLVALFIVSSANAAALNCGKVTSQTGVTDYSGSPTVTAPATGLVTITFTCPTITIPSGITLASITLHNNNDAQFSILPPVANDAVIWSWTYTGSTGLVGGNLASTVTSTSDGSGGFNPCTTVGPLVCHTDTTFSLTSPIVGTGALSPVFTFTVSAAAGSGGGVDGTNGNDSAQITIIYNETSGVPEPGTMAMLGGGLLGLGLIGRRKKKA